MRAWRCRQAVMEDGCLGYQLHREKFGRHYLFVEYDRDQGPPHGTAKQGKTVFGKDYFDDLLERTALKKAVAALQPSCGFRKF